MRLLRRMWAYAKVFRGARQNRTDLTRWMARRPALLGAIAGYEAAVLFSNRVDPRLKALAFMKAASLGGCAFCLDLGSPVSRGLGIDDETLADLPRYAESERFTPLEKAVLDLATAMSSTPAEVSAELRERLLEDLTKSQLAELASAIAWENHRGRLNNALGIRAMGVAGDGFCVLPERRATPVGGSAGPGPH